MLRTNDQRNEQTDRQTNRRTRTSYPRRPSESTWVAAYTLYNRSSIKTLKTWKTVLKTVAGHFCVGRIHVLRIPPMIKPSVYWQSADGVAEWFYQAVDQHYVCATSPSQMLECCNVMPAISTDTPSQTSCLPSRVSSIQYLLGFNVSDWPTP